MPSSYAIGKHFEAFIRQKIESGRYSSASEVIRLILSTLHAAQEIEGMNVPTLRLHPLKGDLKGFYSVTVRANWRVIFRYENGDALDVDFVDYH